MNCPVCGGLFVIEEFFLNVGGRYRCQTCESEWAGRGIVTKQGIKNNPPPKPPPDLQPTDEDMKDFLGGLPDESKESLRDLGFDL